MKNFIKALCLFICTVLFLQMSLAQSKTTSTDDNGIKFKWGFAAKVGPEDNREFVSINRDTMMRSGDSLKMVIELEKMCYVYVLYEDTKGELTLLFPYSLTQFKKDYVINKNYFIPKGRGWNTLDNATGKERFQILASPTQLTDFEMAYTKYLAAKGTSKNDMAKRVKAEIRNTKSKFRSFASAAERPINIGGNVRGMVTPEMKPPDVTDVAIQISGKNFYSKTFTIDHQK